MDRTRSHLLPWLPTLELILAAAAAALWYTQGGWVEYAGTLPGALPLILLAAVWGLRWLATSGRRRSGADRLRPRGLIDAAPPFVGPLVLFLGTAAASLWAAYDLQIAGAKAWLLVGALGFYWALTHQPDRTRIVSACALLQAGGAGIAALATITRDWSTTPLAGTPIARAAGAAGRLLPPALAAETLNANVAGGICLLLLPLSLPLITSALQNSPRRRAFRVVATSALATVTLVGLLLTGSRGAYVAMVTSVGIWVLLRVSRHLSAKVRRVSLIVVALLGIAGLAVGLSIVAGSSPSPSAETGPSSLRNRLWLWQLGFSLVRDVPFTGIGIGMFEMALTLYSLLIHVGFVEHAHNLYLDVAIEQGVLGSAALVMLAATALGWGLRTLWSRSAHEPRSVPEQIPARHGVDRWLLESALVSLSTLLIHGLIDDAIYSSRAVVLFLVPLGLLVAVVRQQHPGAPEVATGHTLLPLRRLGLPVLGTLALTALVVGGIVSVSGSGGSAPAGRLRGTWHANLGAVAQAQIELSTYDQNRFSELSIDEVRRRENLESPRAQFNRAVVLDPSNRTALQRRAMTALARFEYDYALALMQAAWDAGHRDRVTRLLYGDALVAVGRVEDAVVVARGLPYAQARMLGQAWERYRSRGDADRAELAYAAAELME